MGFVIGVDFDNTIASYDQLIHRVVVEWGLVGAGTAQVKKTIRDQIRLAPDGENEWQKVQAEVYGPRMAEAVLIDGVREFFALCRSRGVRAYIVSHKTRYANFDRSGTDLRTAALAWMEAEGFFVADGMGLSASDVFFAETRENKVSHIGRLGCTHFIDDLEEVFLEATFPAGVEKILLGNPSGRAGLDDVWSATNWGEIRDHIFGAG